jgi:Pyruvate/2-oxoacid:ferredoxin oxidoreductase gamma subunit
MQKIEQFKSYSGVTVSIDRVTPACVRILLSLDRATSDVFVRADCSAKPSVIYFDLCGALRAPAMERADSDTAFRAGAFYFGKQYDGEMKMENRDIKDGVRIRRQIYIPPALAARLDRLVARGAVASNVIGVALQRSLPAIEKKIKAGQEIHGLRVRKGDNDGR